MYQLTLNGMLTVSPSEMSCGFPKPYLTCEPLTGTTEVQQVFSFQSSYLTAKIIFLKQDIHVSHFCDISQAGVFNVQSSKHF